MKQAARLLAVALLVGGCASPLVVTDRGPSASVTTLMSGWEQKFALDWQAEPAPDGRQRLRGYVVSYYGRPAEPFRLLGQALDASGAVVAQKIVWIVGGVASLDRTYFEIDGLPTADHYRVTVWDYSPPRR